MPRSLTAFIVTATAALLPLVAVAGDGLAPCRSTMDDYFGQVESTIRKPVRGTLVAAFTAYPAFQTEWGVVVFEDADTYVLRLVRFDQSTWHSAWREIAPGSYARIPAEADLSRSVDEVTISPELARLVRRVLMVEVAAASEDNARGGFDGEIFRFVSAAQRCASTWSPDQGTRADQLVEAFRALRTLARVPTSWLRRWQESSVIEKWSSLAPAASGSDAT